MKHDLDRARAIIEQTRRDCFASATSTTTDAPAAEAAVAVVVAPALTNYQIHWVCWCTGSSSAHPDICDDRWFASQPEAWERRAA